MNYENILNNPKVSQLSPIAFKAYYYLLKKAGANKIIKNFTIRGQVKEWNIDQNMNLTNNKVTLKKILVELENKNLIQHDIKNKLLIIQSLTNYIKTVKVQSLDNGDGFIDIEEFKDIVDITKVKSYKLIPVGKESLSIEFYDQKGNVLNKKV